MANKPTLDEMRLALSKVPKILYHGTGADIKEFRPNSFLSDDPKIAGMYAKSQHRAVEGSGPNIMPVHANLKNPFIFDESDARRKGSSFGKMIAPHASTKNRFSEAIKILKAKGHDGVVLQNFDDIGGRQNQYIVFDPRHIKSAIGNRGTYDINDPDITKAEGGGIDEYQGGHKPPSESYGAPLHDLTQIYPDDIYSHKALNLYGMGHPEHKKMDMESLFKAQLYRNKPDSSVPIFRAVPQHVDKINPQDWVTLSPMYAKHHGESRLGGKYKILKKTVKAKDLWTAGDSIHEWGYHPEEEKKAKGGSVPSEPGSTPIKEGHVRLYHQTDGDNLREIEKHGLLLKHAKGIEGPRAIYAGETPFYGDATKKPTLEFQVPKEHWDAPFVLRDVHPQDFISAHYPWHRHARYLEDESGIKNVLSGKFDTLKGDEGKAVEYIKNKYSTKKAKGGEVHMSEGGKPNDAAFIGYLSPHGKFESYPESVAKANDYHHSYTIKDLDAYNAEGGLTFVRMNSDPEITIKGTPAMDPFHHKNSPMVSDLARRIIKSGGHHDMPIKVEHMGFEKHEAPYQGKYIGTLRQWSMRNAEKKAKGGSVEPKNTVKAYKLFRVHEKHPGKLFPLFVDANTPVEMHKWVDAKIGEQSGEKVKSKIGPLAMRPGWHAGDLPMATHIGEKSNPKLTAPDTRPHNHAWAEVEMPNDKDWQTEANKRGMNKKGELIGKNAHITDQLPKGGHYRYKTNPNMTGNWLIGGAMKVNRVLTDAEVKRINDKHGVADLPRAQPFKKKTYGLAYGGVVAPESWVAEEHVNYKAPTHIKKRLEDMKAELQAKVAQEKAYHHAIRNMPFDQIPTLEAWKSGQPTHAHHLEIEERPL